MRVDGRHWARRPQPGMRGVDQQQGVAIRARRAPPPPPRSCRRRRGGSPPPRAAAAACVSASASSRATRSFDPPAAEPDDQPDRPVRPGEGVAAAQPQQGRQRQGAGRDRRTMGCFLSILPQPPRLARPASIPPRLGRKYPPRPHLYFSGSAPAARRRPTHKKQGFYRANCWQTGIPIAAPSHRCCSRSSPSASRLRRHPRYRLRYFVATPWNGRSHSFRRPW